jgi:hypothetical protein
MYELRKIRDFLQERLQRVVAMTLPSAAGTTVIYDGGKASLRSQYKLCNWIEMQKITSTTQLCRLQGLDVGTPLGWTVKDDAPA